MKKLLKKHFGFDDFRPLQKDIINHVLSLSDAFVLMPTGGGKSLCFQLPALRLPGLTLVISPLIALMKDQVDALQANGIAAEFINSSLNQGQIDEIQEKTKVGKIKLLYVAPERFAVKNFLDFLSEIEISLIAIDEAHCISEWGHDFRPEYRNLSKLKKLLPGVPIIALTATATEKVRSDIIKHLKLERAKTFMSSFDRENLKISVVEKKKAFPRLLNILEKYKQESVIIYCFSRKETEEIADNLNLNGFSASAYHAGLEKNKRQNVQDLFVKDKVNIIVATIAFGMGIDKPDVRLVVHYTFPKTLEGYYQEIGRAGRDGLESECVTFYTYADVRKHEFFINQISEANLQLRAQEKLSDILRFMDLSSCRKKFLLKYFGEEMEKEKCLACDSCLEEKEMLESSEIARKIMSAVLRTASRFGKNYIVAVLLGKNIQKIKINGHDKLSVFGIVDDLDEDELGQIVKQLVDLDFLQKSSGQYPVLSLTKKGAQFLQSDEELELVKPKIKNEIFVNKKTELDFNPDLFEELRKLRSQIAEKENVPPFIIFGDKSLQEMAYYLPLDEKSFSSISGVGEKKLKEYSPAFLGLITGFAKKHKLETIEKKAVREKIIKVKTPRKKFYLDTLELIVKKIPLENIAKNQGRKVPTIINHIEKIIDSGERVDLEYLKLPKDRYKKISKTFDEIGDEFLKPVWEALDGEYSYDEIRLVRVLKQK